MRLWLIAKTIGQIKCRYAWKQCNPHNRTHVGINKGVNIYKLIKDKKVSIGKETYGAINIDTTGTEAEGLIIGSYCSISNKSWFLLGGEHRYDCITTYPVEELLFREWNPRLRKTKGKIIIHDDVWIGDHSLILSGVEVGQGAIVGAGSIVVKDVPPYAIVGGNPAKVIKYRFSQEVIAQLMKYDIGSLNVTAADKKLFCTKLENNSALEVLNMLEAEGAIRKKLL